MARIIKYDYRLNGLINKSPTQYDFTERKQIHTQFDEFYGTLNLDLYDEDGYNRFSMCLVDLFMIKFVLERANKELKDRDFGEVLEQLYSEVDALDVAWQYVLEVIESETVDIPKKRVLSNIIKTIIYTLVNGADAVRSNDDRWDW